MCLNVCVNGAQVQKLGVFVIIGNPKIINLFHNMGQNTGRQNETLVL